MTKYPARFRLARTKGWHMPASAISVARGPGRKWGNPFLVRQMGMVASGDFDDDGVEIEIGPWVCIHRDGDSAVDGFWFATKREAQQRAVELFRWNFERNPAPEWVTMREAATDSLRWHHLGCWCRMCVVHALGKPFGEQCTDCEPCHGDVLGDYANRRLRP